MAAAPLTPVVASRSGVACTLVAATGDGNYFTNDGRQILLVRNDSGAPITVTITTQNVGDSVSSLAVTDRTVSITNATEKVIGPFPQYIYNDATDYVQITYSAVASVYVQVLTVTPEVV